MLVCESYVFRVTRCLEFLIGLLYIIYLICTNHRCFMLTVLKCTLAVVWAVDCTSHGSKREKSRIFIHWLICI